MMETDELEQLERLEKVLEALPGKLEKNAYDYEAYTEWIRLLHQIGDISSIRVAMERMHTVLAIPEELWVQWIEAEWTDAGQADNAGFKNTDNVKHMAHVYDLATAEYLSIDMWQRYIDYTKHLESDAEFRATGEAAFGSARFYLDTVLKAYAATRWHYTESQQIWRQLKDAYEQAIALAGEDAAELVEHLQQKFLERLSQAHAGLDETFASYSEFITQHKNDNYETELVQANQIVGATREQCAKRDKFETELAATDGAWPVFAAYTDSMQRDKSVDAAEVVTVYERAARQFYYSASVWDEYIAYVLDGPRDEAQALVVATRARTNCPWSGKVWGHVISITYAVSGKQDAVAVYYQAVAAHVLDHSMAEFSLTAMALIDIARLDFQLAGGDKTARIGELVATCTSCIDAAYALVVETADPMLRLERCIAHITSVLANDVEAARGLWTRVCRARRTSAEAWAQAAEFEATHGAVANARSLFRQAAQRKLDNPARLFDAWIVFEHSVGNLTTIRSAEHVVITQTNLIQRRAEREAAQIPEPEPELESVAEQAPSRAQKRRRGKHRREEHGDEEVQAMDVVPEQTGAGETVPSENVQPKEDEKEVQAKRAKDKQVDESGDNKTKTTVFVSNLPFAVSQTEIAEFLGSPVQVKSVTMLTNQQGAFRGQARVEMASPIAFMGALAKNGTKLQKRAILVQEFAKPADRPHRPHHPPPGGESVRVVGFAKATTDDYIAGLARPAGDIVDVHRTAQGDKIFLTMQSVTAALKAVELLDGYMTDGKKLKASVAHSRPVMQGKSDVPTTSLVPRKAARRPAKKLAAPAIPAAQREAEDAAMDDPAAGATTTATGAAGAAGKSNDDFRRMFLK
ncbi:Splicing factor [Linderina macrospora]|uniref:Splicing factor n=1 Tax=Linderina macrospora TaxID=4868 RepID=A0ACC1JHI5_9FUNG|nr:Splicing factor [Linderina macrospora]